MPRQITKDSTDISEYFFIVDSADGSPETGVTITDLDLQYVRFGAAPSAKVDATALAATDSAHADNKAIEIDATDQPGLYRVDWPDAAFATGVNGVILTVKGTGFHPAHKEIELVDYDPYDSVRMGMTALPNAAADAAGGLAISDAGGLDLDTKLANTNEITAARMGALTDWIEDGRLDAILDIIAADVVNIDGDAMRGTDSAATAAKLLAYIRLLARSDAAVETDAATELTEINANAGAGAGNFSSQTDSEEAIRDRGDAEWITATGFNTTVPDAAGTAASLHSTTNGKVDAVQGDVTTIAADVANIDGDAMRGTDSANTTVPDAAGTAATLHGITDALISALNNIAASDVLAQAASALGTYDPPTRAELTTDKNSIITEVNANETKIDALPTAATIATAVMAKVVDGTLDVTEALTIMIAVLAGDMAKDSNTYTYDDQSGTVKVTEVASDSAMERTIA